MNHEKENKMSKVIYVFKTKFAKGNFDIQTYELPVENETAKTYFVDNPYTYRSRILKKRYRYCYRKFFWKYASLS